MKRTPDKTAGEPITPTEYKVFQQAYDFWTRNYSAHPCPMCW